MFGKSPSVPEVKPLPTPPQEASYISRGDPNVSKGLPPLKPLTPVVGASLSRVGAPTLLGG